MEIFNNMAQTLREYRRVTEQLNNPTPVPMLVTGLSHIHKAHFLAAMMDEETIAFPLLIITESEATAARLTEDINVMHGGGAYQFPASDMLLTDTEAHSADYSYRRIETLWAALSGRARLIIASAEAAVQLTVPRGVLKAHTVTVAPGDEIKLDELAKTLVAAGYTRCDMIEGKGQFSIRGSLADIYPVNSEYPVRIELWGDEIDTVSSFDLESQRRIDTVKSVTVTPCSETVFESAEDFADRLEEFIKKASRSKAKNDRALAKIRTDIDRLRGGVDVSCLQRYYPVCYPDNAESVFDYAKGLIICESFASAENARGAIAAHLDDLKILTEDGILCRGLDKYLLSKNEYTEHAAKTQMYMDTFMRGGGLQLSSALSVKTMQLSPWSGEYKLLCEELKSYMHSGYSVVVFSGTEKSARLLAQDLRDSGFSADYSDKPKKLYAKKIFVTQGTLSAGFEYAESKIAVITRAAAATAKTAPTAKANKKGRLRSLDEISRGDLVVHNSYGIGVFEGVQKLTADRVSKDYIKIKYAGTDVLYVPVTQLDLISRYIGSGDSDTVKLNKLSTDAWKKSKSRAKAAAKEMATELIALYSKRMKLQGFAFSQDGERQEIFENHFSYIETDDQLRCVSEIKSDMMKTVPMERLLCGDVGFGKTEVALRAAFKCIEDGKQCAILVPTTVLAWQHYQTILKRMDGFDIKAEMLSRFRTPKEQKLILKKLEEGDIDIIVGTHRLVQDDINFFDLGLVIIDEEQRFGVSHKEKLKEGHPEVDILTLSATPIPRTLNMAMSGIRDMSVIETPPGDRHPVTTYVAEYDRGVIAQAISKELRRGGQVYYIHNRVESIYSCAAEIQKMVPETRIGVAHGKMSEEELMDVWRRLIDAEIDVLVCTTIIETGVDVPNVNTLVIENADCMGLAQLHQLRGRVGRTGRRAYAYFTFKRGKMLTEIATKRLEAIREFTRFGSGFRIAMKDLEIRGAGSILGQHQSGHLETVGYDMYLKLLNEAVAEQRGETVQLKPECLIDIKVDAFIPEDYISNQAQRIDCYRKIAQIETEDDAWDVTDELIDRYGDLPKTVEGLIEVARLRHMAQDMQITEVIQNGDAIVFYLGNADRNMMLRVSALSGKFGKKLLLNLTGKPCFKIVISDKDKPLSVLKAALETLNNAS
ncbi:MAG: transcription-repair coupling factor [Eubacterium sp.]|nr:transcription-repair coupling factor [Eubacterium sp.]